VGITNLPFSSDPIPTRPASSAPRAFRPVLFWSAPFHSFDCLALLLGFRHFGVSSAFFPPLPQSSKCLPRSSMLFRTSSDTFRKNWRLPGPSGQNPFLPRTTSKEEGSDYAITSPILNIPRPCAYWVIPGVPRDWFPTLFLSFWFHFRRIT